MLLDEHRVIVLRLREAIELMLGARGFAGLEEEAELGAEEGEFIKVGVVGCNREPKTFSGGQDAIAQIQPQGLRFAGLNTEGEVEHVAHRPKRILHLEIQRDESVFPGLEFEGGEVDGDAVEPILDFIPGVGNQKMNEGQPWRHHIIQRRHSCARWLRGESGPFVRFKTARDEFPERRKRRIDACPNESERNFLTARPARRQQHVVGRELADRLLLFDVGETDFPSRERLGERVHRFFLALRALEQRCLGRGRVRHFVFGADRQQFHLAPGGAGNLEVIPRLVGHRERDRLARIDVAIPVGQLEIVVAAGQARAVVDAGPRRLADAVGRLPPPALDVVGVVDLHLANRHGRPGWQRGRRVVGAIEPVAQIPLVARLGIRERSGWQVLEHWRVTHGEGGDVFVGQHPVVNAELVDVAAADVVVVALDIVRADDARVRAELVQRGVEHGDRFVFRRQLPVHIETDSGPLVPADGEVRPGLR